MGSTKSSNFAYFRASAAVKNVGFLLWKKLQFWFDFVLKIAIFKILTWKSKIWNLCALNGFGIIDKYDFLKQSSWLKSHLKFGLRKKRIHQNWATFHSTTNRVVKKGVFTFYKAQIWENNFFKNASLDERERLLPHYIGCAIETKTLGLFKNQRKNFIIPKHLQAQGPLS